MANRGSRNASERSRWISDALNSACCYCALYIILRKKPEGEQRAKSDLRWNSPWRQGTERHITGRSMASKARKRKVQLILNGKVAGNDALRTAVAQQRAAGHRFDVRVTSKKGDA